MAAQGIRSRLWNRELVFSGGNAVFGAGASQAITLIGTPFLTRLYSTHDWGVFALFASLVMTVSIAASGRYELASVLPDSDLESNRLLVLSGAVTLVTALLVGLVAIAVLAVLGEQAFFFYVVIGFVAVVAQGAIQSLTYAAVRHKRYTVLSTARIVNASAALALSVAWVWWHLPGPGMIIGLTGGAVAGTLVLLIWYVPRLARTSGVWRVGEMAAAARQWSDYPRKNVPHALLDGVRDTGTQAFVTLLFGPSANGAFALCLRVLKAPGGVVGTALAQVVYKDMADSKPRGELRDRVGEIGRWATALAAPFFLVVAIAGPWGFRLVFGQQWTLAGQMARPLSFAALIWFVSGTLSFLPAVLGRLGTALTFALADLAARGASLGIGYLAGSPNAFAWALAVTTGVVSLALMNWYLSAASRADLRADSGALSVAFVGQPHWVRTLRDGLSERIPDGRYGAWEISGPASLFSRAGWRAALRANVLVRVGFRPGARTLRGRLFDAVWGVVELLNPEACRVVYWIGSDVLKAVTERAGHSKTPSWAMRYAHLAGAPWLRAELDSIGVRAEHVRFPATPFYDSPKVSAFDSQFRVLSYVPDAKPEFYGGEQLLEAARRLPDVPFRIAGTNGAWAKSAPASVEFLGWVSDMNAEYDRATVVVREVEHDSLGGTVVEGLMRARHVVYSYEVPYTVCVPFGDVDGLAETIAELKSRFDRGELGLNLHGREYALEAFDPQKGYAALHTALIGVCDA